MTNKTKRTTGKPVSLPARNSYGQLQYRVVVPETFAKEINAEWETAFNAVPKQCLNKTAPAWFDEDRKTWTVTVAAGQTGLYPLGVKKDQDCNVSFRIGADKYTKCIASATDDVASKNAQIAEEKMTAIREALESREFTEKVSGVNAKLRSMSELASETGIPLSDLMAADKIISDEKEKVAAAKRSATKKGSTLRTFVSSGVKTKVEDKPETETPTVTLTAKTITKWEALDEAKLQEAMETYAETVDVPVEDVQAAWELATADIPF